jgi:hypothetical protein
MNQNFLLHRHEKASLKVNIFLRELKAIPYPTQQPTHKMKILFSSFVSVDVQSMLYVVMVGRIQTYERNFFSAFIVKSKKEAHQERRSERKII